MSSERGTIVRHAGTVLVGQLAVMAFGITDTIVAGRFSDTALAALAVGSATYITVHITLMGMLQALLPVWAELHGANRASAVGPSVRQALYLCVLTMLIGMAALSYPQPLLDWTEVPVDMQGEVKHYLWIVALGLPASLLFRMFGTLNQSLGKPKLVTWVQVVALMVKIPLSIVLTLGIDGLLPAIGLVGCAWATFIVNYIMLGLALWLIRTQDFYEPYALWKKIEPPDWPVLKRFMRLGLPSGLTIGVEVTSFTLMSLFIARLGVTATASHQIVSNLAAVMYMVPLSLSIASSARVSYWIGANNRKKARLALRTGLSLVLCMCVALASSLWLGREWVAAFYTQSAEVAQLTVALLAWITLYHLTDAVQVFCVFTLRSYGITVLPLITYTVLLWGVGLAGGYAVAYLGLGAAHLPWLVPQSPIAFWQSSSFALSITSMVLLSVLWRAAYRPTKAVG